jgi:hypothetical protein
MAELRRIWQQYGGHVVLGMAALLLVAGTLWRRQDDEVVSEQTAVIALPTATLAP